LYLCQSTGTAHPEYNYTLWFRQLVVEAILVLILVVEYSVVPYLGGAIEVERIVRQVHACILSLKRVCHEISDFRFFTNHFHPGPCVDYRVILRIDLYFRISPRILVENQNYPHGMLRGPGETDS
jgi:hypothetical protein